MKCEIERMEIIYTFYFFAFFEKVIKKLLTFCYKFQEPLMRFAVISVIAEHHPRWLSNCAKTVLIT